MSMRCASRSPWVLGALAATLLACTPEPPTDLDRAVASVRYMTSPRFLSKSAFTEVYPEPTPSNFVRYLFSEFGVPEWPIAIDEMEAEQLRAARIPALPPTVGLVANRPDPGRGAQLVLRGDDAKGGVVIEVYPDPRGPPVAVHTFVLRLSMRPRQ